MKKLISLLLSLLLITGAALAQPLAEEAPLLTYEELQIFLGDLAGRMAATGDITYEEEGNGVTIAYTEEGALRIADRTLSANTAVLGAALNSTAICPRGMRVGDSLEDLLAIYPNDNPNLMGNRSDAALYIAGEKPEATVGWLLRDGQRINQVTYCVYHWTADGVVSCGVSYQIVNDIIMAISVFGMDQVIPEDQALAEIQDTVALQEADNYFAYPKSLDGASLPPFQREDLAFNGMDFLDLTPEMATQALGSSPVDEWSQDSNGQYLRLKQWDGISILFRYSANKQFIQVDTMAVNGDALEGPRGVRIGDSMESVMYRFCHSQGGTVENGILLYGDGQNPPYGIIAYGSATATITYFQAPTEDRTVIWLLTFVDGVLQTMHFTHL